MCPHVTGPTAIEADIDEVFDGIDTTLLLVTVAVVALLLIATYRSPFLWLVPLTAVGVAAVAASAAVYVVASTAGWQVSTPSTTIMVVLVFGAGTDYALLLVARYREELRQHADRHRAMRVAWRRVTPVVAASALTSSLGLLCLLAAQMNHIRALGLVGAVGIAATAATMLTLFPALLVLAGRRAFWPFVPHAGSPPPRGRGWWPRAADAVTRWPGRMLAGSSLVLGALALVALTLPGTLAERDAFTTPAESVRGYEQLATAYPEHGGRPVVVAAPREREQAVLHAVGATPGVAAPTVEGRTGGWVLVEAQASALPDTDAERAILADLRERLDRAGTEALVGGPAAEQVDAAIAVRRDLWVTIPLVLAVVLLILAVALRAVVAALAVIGAVVLSFGAALGIGALAFRHLFGFAGAEPALAATGPVIVSAGVVLAATFAALMTLPYVPMVQIGFVIAVGILVESMVIPALLLTPLAVRLRHWLWWPAAGPQPAPARAAALAHRVGARE